MTINVNLGQNSYDIVIERGLLLNAKNHINLNRRVFVVTDTGVPQSYAEALSKQCKSCVICTVPEGEGSKSLECFGELTRKLLDNSFSRKDCIVALGGGVVGDLAGFVASTYMRGIDFYNIPSTLLSQVDSSVGGKTAINFGGVKNIVGTFYQPKKVLIDTELMFTLAVRQTENGLAEVIKMAATSDKELFESLEKRKVAANIEPTVIKAISIKKSVVEKDEKEAGLRKVLNFGHTIGHGIEVTTDLYHGEAVALGMLPMCSEKVRERLIKVLKLQGVLRKVNLNFEKIEEAILHDKKSQGDTITTVFVNEIGSFEFKEMTVKEIVSLAKEVLK